MKVTITNNEVLGLNQAINAMHTDRGNVKLRYAVMRNAKLLQPVVESLNEVVKPSEQMQAYQAEMRAIATKHCELENGELVLYTDATYGQRLPANHKGSGQPKPASEESKEAWEKEVEQHIVANKELLDGENEKVNEFNKLLEQSTELEVYAIKLDDLASVGELPYEMMARLDCVIVP